MKPVNASSIYDNNHKPELLTNGSSCTNGHHPAAATKEEDKPWFKVDLQGKFYIRTVTVTPRNSKFLWLSLKSSLKSIFKMSKQVFLGLGGII